MVAQMVDVQSTLCVCECAMTPVDDHGDGLYRLLSRLVATVAVWRTDLPVDVVRQATNHDAACLTACTGGNRSVTKKKRITMIEKCILGETALSQTLLRIVDYKEHLLCLNRNFLMPYVKDMKNLFRDTESSVL